MNEQKSAEKRIKVVSCRDIKTNPFNQSLHPDMFSPNGLNIRKQAKLKGSNPSDKPVDCVVTYDKLFVTRKLANIFQPLVDSQFGTELILHYCRNAIFEAERIEGVEDKDGVTGQSFDSSKKRTCNLIRT